MARVLKHSIDKIVNECLSLGLVYSDIRPTIEHLQTAPLPTLIEGPGLRTSSICVPPLEIAQALEKSPERKDENPTPPTSLSATTTTKCTVKRLFSREDSKERCRKGREETGHREYKRTTVRLGSLNSHRPFSPGREGKECALER